MSFKKNTPRQGHGVSRFSFPLPVREMILERAYGSGRLSYTVTVSSTALCTAVGISARTGRRMGCARPAKQDRKWTLETQQF